MPASHAFGFRSARGQITRYRFGCERPGHQISWGTALPVGKSRGPSSLPSLCMMFIMASWKRLRSRHRCLRGNGADVLNLHGFVRPLAMSNQGHGTKLIIKGHGVSVWWVGVPHESLNFQARSSTKENELSGCKRHTKPYCTIRAKRREKPMSIKPCHLARRMKNKGNYTSTT